ncbi:hypothetical protein C8F01DRAFT_1115826 [Mycena amicta]|nr:hypothetical protein C8F01DRAFT_1115826 [Mycena amicta]
MVLSPKSADRWTTHELAALNISIETVDAPSFFGNPLPDPSSDPTLLAHPVLIQNLTHPSSSEAISKDHSLFFRYLQHATGRFPLGTARDHAIDDFTASLLRLLDYDEPKRFVHQHLELDLLMCRESVTAKSDVVIMDHQDHLLIVQHSTPDAQNEPRLIAAAIAAHYENNRRRWGVGLPTVPARVFPGILMIGTTPTFYQIPVSEALVEAVGIGQYPPAATVVKKLFPPTDSMRNHLADGMVPLANRQLILQCFGAFRRFVV